MFVYNLYTQTVFVFACFSIPLISQFYRDFFFFVFGARDHSFPFEKQYSPPFPVFPTEYYFTLPTM